MLMFHAWMNKLYMTFKAKIALDGGVVGIHKQTAVLITLMSKF